MEKQEQDYDPHPGVLTLEKKTLSSIRFYPETLPEFEHEPTKERFEIIETSNSGKAVVSKTHFYPNDVVAVFTGFLLKEITLFTLQIKPGLHIHDPFFMGRILHSCSPNTSCDMENLVFTATKEIMPGDIITMDYEEVEDALYRPFECSCGSENCRGIIRGKLYREEYS